MKFKKIVSICKSHGVMVLYRDKDKQWLSDRMAAYPLFEIPELTETGLQRICDFTDKQWDKILFDMSEMPEEINFGDADDRESRCETGDMSVSYKGRMITPVHTEEGILFIDARYLEPFADMPERELYLRESEAGIKYFAVKLGLLIYGIIMPYGVNEEFTVQLGRVYDSCKIAEKNNQGADTL